VVQVGIAIAEEAAETAVCIAVKAESRETSMMPSRKTRFSPLSPRAYHQVPAKQQEHLALQHLVWHHRNITDLRGKGFIDSNTMSAGFVKDNNIIL
jgi:hypothetical protein